MSEEILKELNDLEIFRIKDKASYVIKNENGLITFHQFYRAMGNWVLSIPFFSEKCDFEKMKILAKKVFKRWRPLFSEHYLFVKDSFIITNLEDVMLRAVLFCALGNDIDKINGLSVVQTAAWSEVFLTADKEYYERAKKVFKILFGDSNE